MTSNRDELEALKGRLSLSAYVGRRVRLSKRSGEWFGRCPFHDEKSPSFTVNDSKGFFHCFGCQAHGDLLDWWQRVDGLSFNEAADHLRREAGAVPLINSAGHNNVGDDDLARKQAEALAIWHASAAIGGTVAETYLRTARCISLDLPDCLRCHPGLRPNPREAIEYPVMVAAVTGLAGEIVAIQRTFLHPDGRGKADIESPKRSLGPIKRGAVCLAPAGSVIGLAEGIETGLSAMELYRIPVWCALGAHLSRIILPPIVQHVALFADRGAAGEAAAEDARQAFRAQGRKVVIRFSKIGKDFNDELRARHHGI
ncbi:DUF7146 domain-containing protein [Labrys neptuniae]|uniref:CHC2 zinc finger domain-containing protein n=1 Tax=Labrys neptuniae TaxID=376174 RepID=A0ABV3PIL9_9HYPH